QVARVPLPGWPPPCDLVHATDVVVPFTGRIPAVVTVHDLSFLRAPDHHTPLNRAALRAIAPRAIRHARLVLADSHATARDLEACYGLPADRIRVVYPGCALERFRPCPGEDAGPVLARYGIERPYLLFVGTLEPRKNLSGLIDAFELLAQGGLDHRLVLAGRPGWGFAAIESRLAAQRSGHRVIRTGRVAEDDLPALYRAADAFVYPSHYEGFGLPVLEAMACGTPVVTSDRSSLPEVVGEAGLMVDPGDVEALARAIAEVLGSGAVRERLRTEGPRRAAAFTWRRAAEQVAAAYAEVA
ncbi:MAG TPA: glycosyltransferase family 1 protein, partial [Candidatus Eisenbacteria bacterium]